MALAVLCVVSSSEAMGVTRQSAGTGNWNVGTTWAGGTAPAAGDDAVINAGHTVTLTANANITGLTINGSGGVSTATFTLGDSRSLVVNSTLSGTGAVTLSGADTNTDC